MNLPTAIESLRTHLARRPLHDPLSQAARLTLLITAYGFFQLVYYFWNISNLNLNRVSTFQLLLPMAVPMLLHIGFGILVYRLMDPRRRHTFLYLRAFALDERNAVFIRLTATALGSDARLTGIRPPSLRVKWGWRLLFSHVTSLRYADSRFLDLESDPAWMVRLHNTACRASGALVDIRQITPFVEDELRMLVETLGGERLLLIGDHSRSLDEWRRTAGNVSPHLASCTVIIPDDEDRTCQEIAAFSGRIKSLPREAGQFPGRRPLTDSNPFFWQLKFVALEHAPLLAFGAWIVLHELVLTVTNRMTEFDAASTMRQTKAAVDAIMQATSNGIPINDTLGDLANLRARRASPVAYGVLRAFDGIVRLYHALCLASLLGALGLFIHGHLRGLRMARKHSAAGDVHARTTRLKALLGGMSLIILVWVTFWVRAFISTSSG